jgi:hypothetical protein
MRGTGSFGLWELWPVGEGSGKLGLAWGTGSLGDGDVALAGSVREGFAVMKRFSMRSQIFSMKILRC